MEHPLNIRTAFKITNVTQLNKTLDLKQKKILKLKLKFNLKASTLFATNIFFDARTING